MQNSSNGLSTGHRTSVTGDIQTTDHAAEKWVAKSDSPNSQRLS